MSINAFNEVKEMDLKLPPTAMYVLYMLAHYANDDYIAWPSFSTLATATRLARFTVIRQIQILESMGVITKLEPQKGHSNRYRINAKGSHPQLLPSHPGLPPQQKEVVTHDDHLVTVSDQGSHPQLPPLVTHSDPINQLKDHRNYFLSHTVEIDRLSESVEDDRSDGISSLDFFDEFWECYPWKAKKKKARDIWKRKRLAKKGAMIIADVKARVDGHGMWLDGFYPMPTTYLNGEEWESPIDPKRRAKGEGANPQPPAQRPSSHTAFPPAVEISAEESERRRESAKAGLQKVKELFPQLNLKKDKDDDDKTKKEK